MQGRIRWGRRWAGAMIAVMVSLWLCLAAAPALTKPAVTAPAASPVPPSTASTVGDVDPQVARALTQLRNAGDTQFDFSPTPERPRAPEFAPPRWLVDFFRWLGGDGRGLMTALAYLLIGGVILYVLYLFVPAVRDGVDAVLARWRKPKPLATEATVWQPDADVARNLLAEADRLAAAGQFTEAVHLLLGRSLEELAARRPGLLKPALTARAIALLDDLPAAARQAFASLARAVERGLWAQRALGAADWQQARADYTAFALGQHWQGARA